ncbi:winged helix-turn-helix domain-containing protein [bacterium]|nr:winged helix-turn-helix domain-containing protein [candidate division CSSED10-310 bacterium]
MDFKEAAITILKREGRPLTPKQITEIALRENLIDTMGKTPQASMASRIYMDMKRNGDKSVFIKIKKGYFALRETLIEQFEIPDQRAMVFPESKELIELLKEKQFKSDSPNEFEKLLRDAFDSLGFEAELIGGSGDTDVLLTANVGRKSFKVNVDGKTSKSGKIIERQIDWISLRDHKQKNKADSVVVVGHDFSGGNLELRANEYDVSLLKTDELVELLLAHAKFPFTLLELRDLFSGKGGCSQQVSDLLTQNHSRRILLEQFRIIIEEMQLLQDRLGYFTFDSLAGREKMEELEVDPQDIDYIIRLLRLPFINGVEEVDTDKFVLTIRKKEMANIFREFSNLLEDKTPGDDEVVPEVEEKDIEKSLTQPKKRKYGSRYFKWEIRGSSAVATAREENPYEHHCPLEHFKTILDTVKVAFEGHNVINTDLIFSMLEGREIAPNRAFKGVPEVYKIRMTLGILEIEGIITWTGSKRPIEYILQNSLKVLENWTKSISI